MMADLVALWEVSLSDGKHRIEFEHGTTSGKRVITVDGKEVLRKNWMFKLVGRETFNIGKVKGTINIDASGGFSYEYTLDVDGKSLKKFVEQRSKTARVWCTSVAGMDYRIVLEKDTMDVWCNGAVLDTAGEFVDDGTETHFNLPGSDHSAYIKAVSSGKRREGIIHVLFVNGIEVPESND
ncbi:fas apoptotic inhibitory molecule 1-like [Amphiura filiformis]|uniref:fas apoptotic inhibitory molecule 1-like n=1 Tax=Amphiura filiformis TaxID=82378 RepID=UPI003B21885E